MSWGGCILYAVAETEEEAREQAMKAGLSEYGLAPEPPYGGKWPFVLGEPDRVLDVPCAEIYQWSE